MTREELQKAASDAFKVNSNIAIQAATSVGKSKIALNLCTEFAEENKTVPKLLIIIAERAHYSVWEEEITKWSYKGPVFVACYASLKKYRDTDWDIIIFDEAHHLGSELRLDIFDTISAKKRIFLSATLKDSIIYRLEQSCGSIVSVKLGLQEAFKADILPEPKIFLIPMELDNTEYSETIVEEWGNKGKRLTATCMYAERWNYLRNKKKIPNGKLVIKCTQKQKYDYLCEQFEFYKKRYFNCRNELLKNKWLQCGSKRKTYLGSLKTETARNLLKTLKNKRLICFCTNIEQADCLGGKHAIHSKKKNNLDIIKNFNEKKENSLFAVGMLQEGANLVDIEVGIIIQLDGEERAFIQKFGRTLRADSPLEFILYFKGTRDEEYLNNALLGIDNDYIKEINYNEYYD